MKQVSPYLHIRCTEILKRQLRAFSRRKRWSEAQAARYLIERGLKLKEA